MMYKKIGDTIPSLSSLLLAGVLFGGGCKDSKDNSNSSDTGTDHAVSSAPEEGNQEADKTVFDPALNEAAMQMINVFIKSSGLGFLGASDAPLVLQEEDIKGGGERVVSNLKKLCESLSTGKVYESLKLKELLSDLRLLQFRTGTSKSGLQHKYACGQALNAIAEPVKKLFDILEKVKQKVDAKASLEELRELYNDSLQPLLLSLELKNTNLKDSFKFYDTEGKPELLTGPQLARLLSGKDEKNQPKTSQYGVPDLMQKVFSSVWIKSKNAGEGCHGDATLDYLYERGSGISDGWKVQGTGTLMPKIEKINNEKLAGKLKLAQLTGKAHQERLNLILQNQIIDSKPQGSLASDAAVQADLTFGTLLFTVFRGGQSFDFLELAKFSSKGKAGDVQLIGNNENFQALVKLLETGKENEFAEKIGEHISAHMSDIFIIPNVADLERNILNKEVNEYHLDLANEGGIYSPTSELTLGHGSLLYIIYKNIFNMLGIELPTGANAPWELFQEIRSLGLFSDTNDFERSDATISQRMCFALAKQLTSSTFLGSLNNMKAPTLISRVRSEISAIVDKAIVKRNGGSFQPTQTTRSLIDYLRLFRDALKGKYGSASVRYPAIRAEIIRVKGNNSNTDFDINQVREVIYERCEELKNILTVSVVPALSVEGDITSDNFPDITLLQSNLEELNKIKKQYQEKKQKTTIASGA